MLKLRLEEIINCDKRKEKGKNSPVLVDHVRNSESIIDNLAPSVSVEVLRTQLGGGEVPGGRVSESRILVDLRELLARLEEFLQTEEVAVDTVAGASFLGILCVLCEGSAEQADDFFAGGVVVLVGLAEGDALV